MKKLLIALAIILAPFVAEAQIKTPQASPKGYIKQTVGLTDVEVTYSRPGARGRAVFGNLVPFGKLWRTGANENTIINFGDDVVIDGKTLKKGKYSIYTIPRIESWEVIFYLSTDNWGLPENWSDAYVALRTTVKEDALPTPVETFTIGINNLDQNSGYLEMAWENSHIALKFEVPTAKLATASIQKALAGPTWNDYYAASQYLFQSNGNIMLARDYVDKALELSSEKPFYVSRLKSLIQAKQGDKTGAIETAKISLAAAEAANNQDYVKMNKDSISEWSR
jgi:tetratricopeptide (TPR) repeat protein